jgi:adenylylsulfate kinase-like enzyme
VPHDRESPVTLEAQRVRSIDGDTIRYDLGREVVTIEADSGAASRFIREVAQGRCSARADVSLVPVRKSPFNDRFKAARPH